MPFITDYLVLDTPITKKSMLQNVFARFWHQFMETIRLEVKLPSFSTSIVNLNNTVYKKLTPNLEFIKCFLSAATSTSPQRGTAYLFSLWSG